MKSRTKPALRVVPTAEVQISLPVQGVLQDVKHAFYGLCIHAGREVLTQMLEADRVALCGVKNVADPHRRAVRGGSTSSRVVLGGQRIAIKRPRVRSIDAGEIELPSFAWAAGGDPLDMATMAATRRRRVDSALCGNARRVAAAGGLAVHLQERGVAALCGAQPEPAG